MNKVFGEFLHSDMFNCGRNTSFGNSVIAQTRHNVEAYIEMNLWNPLSRITTTADIMMDIFNGRKIQ